MLMMTQKTNDIVGHRRPVQLRFRIRNLITYFILFYFLVTQNWMAAVAGEPLGHHAHRIQLRVFCDIYQITYY